VEIILEKEREASIFTEEGTNTLYKKFLLSESIEDVVNRYKPNNMELSQVSISLLLYRLVDVIAFFNNQGLSSSKVPRTEFPTLPIPVCSFFVHSVLALSLINLNLSRAGRYTVMTGPVLLRTLEKWYTHMMPENLVTLLRSLRM
jgi:hypothetical protein